MPTTFDDHYAIKCPQAFEFDISKLENMSQKTHDAYILLCLNMRKRSIHHCSFFAEERGPKSNWFITILLLHKSQIFFIYMPSFTVLCHAFKTLLIKVHHLDLASINECIESNLINISQITSCRMKWSHKKTICFTWSGQSQPTVLLPIWWFYGSR